MSIKQVDFNEWPGEFPNGDSLLADREPWPTAPNAPSLRMIREHEGHGKHVPTCYLCREVRRLGMVLEAKA